MEYEIASNGSQGGLVEDINDLIKDGWQPIGGISILHHQWENERKGYTEEETTFYQAILKNSG